MFGKYSCLDTNARGCCMHVFLVIDIISTDEDPGLRIESFALIKLRGVTTKFKIYFFTMQTFKELIVQLYTHIAHWELCTA